MVNATIRAIDEYDAGRILTRFSAIVGNLLALVPIIVTLAGVCLCGGAFWLTLPDGIMADRREWDEQLSLSTLFLGGLLLAGAGGYVTFRNMTLLASWYLLRKARRVIKQRMEYAVDPDAPEAMFVEIVPRANWNRLMFETATDVGFLVCDGARSQVLIEGDKDVYRLPRSAIIACNVEWTFIGGSEGGIKYYFTVLVVQTATGLREIPIAYRGDMGSFGAAVREERAIGLRDRILAL